jgi:Fe2+ or Zn2+ uptake regulation protein
MSALFNVSMMSISNKLTEYCIVNKIGYSVKRKEVVNALESTKGFIGAENLWMQILKRNRVKMSLASVYLTLKWLVKIGFAEKKDKAGKSSIYRIAGIRNPKTLLYQRLRCIKQF